MNDSRLYYNSPASCWEEALPLGNGSLGAMCYGTVKTEVIALNHDTLWTGHPRTVKKDGAFSAYKKAQSLVKSGNYLDAQKEIESNFLTCWSQAYMPFGNLLLNFSFDKFSDYERELNLENAVLTNRFDADGIKLERTAFTSHPDKVLAYQIKSLNNKAFSFTAEISCALKSSCFTQEDLLIADGECPGDADTQSPLYPCNKLIYSDNPNEKGVQFRGALKIKTDGLVIQHESTLEVKEATRAVLLFTIQTSFNGFDHSPALEGKEYKQACIDILNKAYCMDFNTLLERHIGDYRAYYSRMSFQLSSNNSDSSTTDYRIKSFEANRDNSLYVLLFNYGRYLLISSSREDSLATNLQGIWNSSIKPPWNSNYTTNINTQMNYWCALPCAMPELMQPLVRLIEDLAKTGSKTAKTFYNANGFVVHHNTDIWGHSVPVCGSASWAYFPGGSGWLCRSLYELYEYTLDINYLKHTAFPLMKEAAVFYLDILTQDDDGTFMICPATSPENCFTQGNESISVSKSTAMLNSIVLDLLTNCKKICEILNIKDSFYDKICNTVPKIKPLVIGENGTILEWNEPLEETEIHHRHVSHLYALHPAGMITKKDTDLFEACRKTLEIRGDDATGWSLAWKVNFWARLLDGNHALNLIDKLLTIIEPSDVNYEKGGVYPNLFDAHPPFQIDGNFGVVSGMCELLLQSSEDTIYLLPALPDAWQNGSIEGIAARGNITVDIKWQNGKITDYSLHGDATGIEVVLCR